MRNDNQDRTACPTVPSQERCSPATDGAGDPSGHDVLQVVRLLPVIEVERHVHLDERTAEIAVVAALTVLADATYLKNRIGDALRAGCTPGEVEEAVMLASQFSGALTAANALRIASDVFSKARLHDVREYRIAAAPALET